MAFFLKIKLPNFGFKPSFKSNLKSQFFGTATSTRVCRDLTSSSHKRLDDEDENKYLTMMALRQTYYDPRGAFIQTHCDDNSFVGEKQVWKKFGREEDQEWLDEMAFRHSRGNPPGNFR